MTVARQLLVLSNGNHDYSDVIFTHGGSRNRKNEYGVKTLFSSECLVKLKRNRGLEGGHLFEGKVFFVFFSKKLYIPLVLGDTNGSRIQSHTLSDWCLEPAT